MDQLIEALILFRQLAGHNVQFPTNCEHDTLRIYPGVDPANVSPEDMAKLEELGFHLDDEFGDDGCWYSFRFGSN